MQFGVNHLGHFLFTLALMPLLKAASDPRVINVASTAHYSGKMRYEYMTKASSKYNGMAAYSQSKLANVLFTKGMAKYFPCISTHALHPGVVATSIANKGMTGFKPFMCASCRLWFYR